MPVVSRWAHVERAKFREWETPRVAWRTAAGRGLLIFACCLVLTGLLLPLRRYYMDVDLVTVRGMAVPLVGSVCCAAAIAFLSVALRGFRRSLASVFTAGLSLGVIVVAATSGPSGTSIHPAVGSAIVGVGLVLGASGSLLVARGSAAG